MKTISRKEALERGLQFYHPDTPCKRGHTAPRYTANYNCTECWKKVPPTPEQIERRKVYIKEYRKGYVYTLKGASTALLNNAKQRAKTFNREYDLDRAWLIEHMSAGVCEVTGIPFELSNGDTRVRPFSPSVDRIDSSKGYTKDNCRVVLTIYNTAKNEFSDADVLKMATALMSHKFYPKS
jgi:hypothetical protein